MTKLTLTLLLAIPGVVCSAQDGNQASLANIEAKVQIVKPISVERKADLVFGQLIVDKTRGYGIVTVSYDGTTDLGGSNMWWKNNGGNAQAHPAEFEVTGEMGYGYTYRALEARNLKKDGQDTPITLTTMWDGNPNAYVGGRGSGTITSTFKIGGFLTVSRGTGPGTYSGSFEVHVSYL